MVASDRGSARSREHNSFYAERYVMPEGISVGDYVQVNVRGMFERREGLRVTLKCPKTFSTLSRAMMLNSPPSWVVDKEYELHIVGDLHSVGKKGGLLVDRMGLRSSSISAFMVVSIFEVPRTLPGLDDELEGEE